MKLVKVDSNVRSVTRRAIEELRDVDAVMDEVVQETADFLVQNDPYQNRTGDLRGSTQAETIELGGGAIESIVTMGMHYASFVIARGFSNWEDAVEDAERDMDRAISAIATRVTRGR